MNIYLKDLSFRFKTKKTLSSLNLRNISLLNETDKQMITVEDEKNLMKCYQELKSQFKWD